VKAHFNAFMRIDTSTLTDIHRVLMKHFMYCRRVYGLCMEVVVCREEGTSYYQLHTHVRPSPHHRKTKRVFQYYASPRLILDNPVQGSE